MKLYIKQKVFSWGDKFRIYDEFGTDIYYVEGEVFSFGKKLHLYSADGTEQCFIQQKVLSFLPKYYIIIDAVQSAEVIKEFTFFRPEYTVVGPGWKVTGDFFNHEYSIGFWDSQIASVSKRWFTWGDTYEIDIADPKDVIMALGVVLIIDAVLAESHSSSASHRHHY